jgi:hypothetical protein
MLTAVVMRQYHSTLHPVPRVHLSNVSLDPMLLYMTLELLSGCGTKKTL